MHSSVSGATSLLSTPPSYRRMVGQRRNRRPHRAKHCVRGVRASWRSSAGRATRSLQEDGREAEQRQNLLTIKYVPGHYQALVGSSWEDRGLRSQSCALRSTRPATRRPVRHHRWLTRRSSVNSRGTLRSTCSVLLRTCLLSCSRLVAGVTT